MELLFDRAFYFPFGVLAGVVAVAVAVYAIRATAFLRITSQVQVQSET